MVRRRGRVTIPGTSVMSRPQRSRVSEQQQAETAPESVPEDGADVPPQAEEQLSTASDVPAASPTTPGKKAENPGSRPAPVTRRGRLKQGACGNGSGSGTKVRSVDFLTPEQLRRKREGDRLSQKQARERTKLLIAELQNKVQDLEAQNKGLLQELSVAAASTSASASTTVPCGFCGHSVSVPGRQHGPDDHRNSHDDHGHDNTKRSYDDAELAQVLTQMLGQNDPGLGFLMCPQAPCFDEHALTSSPLYETLLPPTEVPGPYHPQVLAGGSSSSSGSGSGSDAGSMQLDGGPPASTAGASSTTSFSSPPMPLPLAMALPTSPPGADAGVLPPLAPVAAFAQAQGRPLWSILPPHVESTCPLDDVVLDLLRRRRPLELTGGNVQEFQRRVFPSIQSLLNPAPAQASAPGPIPTEGGPPATSDGATDDEQRRNPVTSTIVNGIVRVMTVHTLPEQLAILYIMSSVVRWLISPTEANYESMPPWLRPTLGQLAEPHPPWVDLFPWPRARERFSRDPAYHGQHLLLSRVCNESLSVNWPHSTADMVLPAAAVGGGGSGSGGSEYVLSPQFERHIKNSDNWTLGPRIYEVFPGLKDCINIA